MEQRGYVLLKFYCVKRLLMKSEQCTLNQVLFKLTIAKLGEKLFCTGRNSHVLDR